MADTLQTSSARTALSLGRRRPIRAYLDAWLWKYMLGLVALFGALNAAGIYLIFGQLYDRMKGRVEEQVKERVDAALRESSRLDRFIEGLINSNRDMIVRNLSQLTQIENDMKGLVDRSRSLQDGFQANATRGADIQIEMERQRARVADLDQRSVTLQRMIDTSSQEAARLERLGQQADRIAGVIGTFTSMLDAIRASPELRQELSASFAFPPGAVVSFSANCPNGWLDYREASGRVIVGAGEGILGDRALTRRLVGENGGSEAVALTRANLPNVSYPLPLNQLMQAVGDSRSDRLAVMRDGVSGRGADLGSIGPLGQGEPVPIMPPFLVLNFCIKG